MPDIEKGTVKNGILFTPFFAVLFSAFRGWIIVFTSCGMREKHRQFFISCSNKFWRIKNHHHLLKIVWKFGKKYDCIFPDDRVNWRAEREV